MKRTIVLLGKGELAIKIGNWLLDSPDWYLMEVIPVIPEPTWTDSISTWARMRGVPLVTSGDFTDSTIPSADVCLSVYYNRILPAWFLAQFRQPLNLHNAPLPKYRGVRPINHALRNGEEWHGVTIHRMTPQIDDGPILAQCRFRIDPAHDEVRDVYERCLHHGWELFLDLMEIGIDNILPVIQDESNALYYSEADSVSLGDRIGWRRGGYPAEGWSSAASFPVIYHEMTDGEVTDGKA